MYILNALFYARIFIKFLSTQKRISKLLNFYQAFSLLRQMKKLDILCSYNMLLLSLFVVSFFYRNILIFPNYGNLIDTSFQLNEQLEILAKDDADPKAREIFHEASRTLEMANPNDLKALGETMFQGKIQTYTSITFEP